MRVCTNPGYTVALAIYTCTHTDNESSAANRARCKYVRISSSRYRCDRCFGVYRLLVSSIFHCSENISVSRSEEYYYSVQVSDSALSCIQQARHQRPNTTTNYWERARVTKGENLFCMHAFAHSDAFLADWISEICLKTQKEVWSSIWVNIQ